MQARSRWGTAFALGVIVVGMFSRLERTPISLPPLDHTGSRKVPVTIVVFDELPVASLMDGLGRIDRATYPSFGRLASTSTWYRNATTTGVMTKDALPAILTGRRSSVGSENRNLFTLLDGLLDVHVSEIPPAYCPKPECSTPGKAPVVNGRGFLPRGDRGGDFYGALDAIDGAKDPAIHVIHSVLPHSPWRYLPSGQIYQEEEPEPGEIDVPGPGRRWSSDAWLTTQVYQRHLLQTMLVDRMLGDLFEKLRDERMFRRSLLIVTADHGIGFVPGEHKRLISETNVGGIAAVPLFVKLPGQSSGAVSDDPVEVIDILPTVVEVLGLHSTWAGVEGMPLSNPQPGRRRVVEGHELSSFGLEKYTVIRAKESTFGRDDAGALDPFLVAPEGVRHLIGRRANDLPMSSLLIDLDNDDAYTNLDPDADVFPALISGSLDRRPPDRLVLAVAVNGRVVAVTRTFETSDGVEFYAMLPPRAFERGTNGISLYLVDGAGLTHRIGVI